MIALALLLALALALHVGDAVEWSDPATKEVSTGVVTRIDEHTGYVWILPDRSKHFYVVAHPAFVRRR